jgi:5-formyltetrahydrofolate cyclo-ligase
MNQPPGRDREVVVSKKRLRAAVLAKIAALGPDLRRAEERELATRFSHLPGWSDAETVLLYVTAFPEELRTEEYLTLAYQAGKRVICPRVDRAARELRLHRIEDPRRELRPGTLGIPEPRADLPEAAPESIDWVLVPGLAFDEQGYRLGRGAGHYDRLLPRLRPDTVCWSLCLSCQLISRLPIEPHDRPLNGVSAPGRTILGARGNPDRRSALMSDPRPLDH